MTEKRNFQNKGRLGGIQTFLSKLLTFILLFHNALKYSKVKLLGYYKETSVIDDNKHKYVCEDQVGNQIRIETADFLNMAPNVFGMELLAVMEKYQSKNAVIYYETENLVRTLTYKQLREIAEKISDCLNNFPHVNCFGLMMNNNPFIPSIVWWYYQSKLVDFYESELNFVIFSLQNLNCAFVFLESYNPIIDSIGIMICYDKEINIPNFNFTNTIELFWNKKLYIYKSNRTPAITLNNNINYIIQTSGSSGDPKIVYVETNCIYSNVQCLRKKLEITHEDLIYFGTVLTFDPSIIELYLSLTTGATLLIISKKLKINTSKLFQILFKEDNRVTFLQMCPSLFMRWSEEELDYILNSSSLRILLLGGENFPKKLENWKSKFNTRIFNIYGITEVSCWASIEEFSFGDEISLGEPLDDTSLEVRNGNGEKILDGEGELYIGSTKRICYIANEIVEMNIEHSNFPLFRKTGDLVTIKTNKIFYKCRIDDTFKRFGIQINSNNVEEKIFQLTQLDNKLIYLEDKQKLILFIRVDEKNQSVKIRICDKLRVRLLHNLEKQYFPDYIETLSDFPLNSNGKTDKIRLKIIADEILANQTVKSILEDEVDVFERLWRKYLCVSKSFDFSDKHFYELGGSSVQRLQFSNEYKNLIKNYSLPNDFFDYLFTTPYNQVIDFLKNYNFDYNRVNNKKIKTTNDRILLKWSYDFKACVDTIPYIIKKSKRIAIGAFSNIFAILNLTNGEEISKTNLPNAIENCCISTISGEMIFLGCYDSNLYCIQTQTGEIIWNHKTNDKIKNTPQFITDEKAIVFGSYDKHLYCLETKTGKLTWKTCLESGITANVLILKLSESIFVSTIKGECFLLDKNGKVIWKILLSSPVFSSPRSSETEDKLYVAEVQGILNCVNRTNGNLVWNYSIKTHIYSDLKIHRKLLLFTSHGGFIHCIEEIDNNPKERFKIKLDSPSSSNVEVANVQNKEYLITASINGSIYIIDLCEENILVKFNLNAEIFSSPAVYIADDKELMIFIGCRDNKLHCLQYLYN